MDNIYNLKLKSFVEKKQKVLDEFGVSEPRYCTQEDIDDIMTWGPEYAKGVWDFIVDFTKSESFRGGLVEFTCPWCVMHRNDCVACNYAAVNMRGSCTSSFSEYSQLIHSIQEKRDEKNILAEHGNTESPVPFEPFTVHVYREILKEIDAEFSENKITQE